MELLFIFLPLIALFYLMNRGNKQRQRLIMETQNSLEPGVGVRLQSGMYAEVKDVRDDTVVLEIEPGVHAVYAKYAVAAILDADEFQRIVNGEPEHAEDDDEEETPVVPDDASSLTETEDAAAEDDGRVGLEKPDADEEHADTPRNAKTEGENESRA